MSSENVTQREVWAKSADYSTMFRCHTGKGYVPGGGKPIRLANGDVLVPAGRPIALGLSLVNGDPVVGTHDLIGWTTIKITPEMVGKEVAVITTIETKSSTGGRRRPDQIKFMENVQRAGGISGFAKCAADVVEIMQQFLTKLRS